MQFFYLNMLHHFWSI